MKMSLTALQLWLSHAILERGRQPKDTGEFVKWFTQDALELSKLLKEKKK